MSAISIVGLWFMLGSLTVVSPAFPPNAFLGGTVIAQVHFTAGDVDEIKFLYGEEPFVDSCRAALEKWQAEPSENGDELVILHFRQPYLYELGDPREPIDVEVSEQSLPFPLVIVHPSYPPNALGEGSVALRAEISDKGKVSQVQVIEGMGVLTDASLQAIRRWEFTPAKDKDGEARASHAYAIFVYRYPNVAN